MPAGVLESDVSALTSAVKAAFRESFNQAQDNLPWMQLTTDLGKSNHAEQNLDWLGEVPDMQDVTRDALRVDGMYRFSYSITHKEFKAALPVRITDLETDNQNQIGPRVKGLARRAAGHPGRLAFDQLEDNPDAFDDTALFADSRTYGGGSSMDNKLAGSGTGASNIEADLQTVRTTMMRFEDDKGEPMELAPNALVIPPDRGLEFAKVLGGVRDPGGTTTQLAALPPGMTNVWAAGGYQVFELARLTDTDNWYALHYGEELNPFVYSWVTKPGVMNSPSMNDDSAVQRSVLIYAVRGYYNVGVSLPHYFVSVVN